MPKIKRWIGSDKNGEVAGYHFWCPGCEEIHSVTTQRPANPHQGWQFNEDLNLPTFSPSVLVTGFEKITDSEYARIMNGEKIDKAATVCHSFVRAGQIQYLSDCTHALAGQTVPLPDWDTRYAK